MSALTELSSSYLTLTAIASAVLVVAYLISQAFSQKNDKPLPPGPPGKMLIGNLLDMPTAASAQAYYTQLGKQYGPLSSLTIFGQSFIVINDYHMARELLDKRANNYSLRPNLPMLGDLMGLNDMMLLEQPGDRFNRMRKIAQTQLGSTAAVSKYKGSIDAEIRRYLLRTLDDPTNVVEHLRVQAATVILKILYGYEVKLGAADPLIQLSEEFTKAVITAGVPGEWMVDAMPILKYVPSWFPGAAWRRQADIWAETVKQMQSRPFAYAKDQAEKSETHKSAVSQTLGAYPDGEIAWTALSLLGGGADTTMGSLEMFYLAMTTNPDVMMKAQAEIDRVVGIERFVDENDRTNLPYTDALLKEVMRWESILEVNFPHCAAEDDHYGGYFIPKGSIILENMCGFFHDPVNYEQPDQFMPERFLKEKPELDPFELVWGHGRRVCPGRHLAYITLWYGITRTLQVFDIRAIPGQLPKREFTFGVIRRPLPFKTNIRIRSTQHEALVRSIELQETA